MLGSDQVNRRRFLHAAGASALLAGSAAHSNLSAGQPSGPAREMAEAMGNPALVKLITLDPAHFHAALAQKQMLPGIDRRVAIFAPLGPDLLAHLKLIEQFNNRAENPTSWELDIHCSNHSLEEMIASK